MYRTDKRKLAPTTGAVLDYLLEHPHATAVKVAKALRFDRRRVYSVMYQYGFINSDKSIENHPTLWPIGEEIRQRWTAKQTAQLITEQPVQQAELLSQAVEQKPTRGQQILREVIQRTDTSDLVISLKAEVAYLRHVVAYLETQRNGNAV